MYLDGRLASAVVPSSLGGTDAIAEDLPPPFCQAGHPDTPENRDAQGCCLLCRRHSEKQWRRPEPQPIKSKRPPRWDGTIQHLWKLKLIEVQGQHWLWRGKVNRRTKRPAFGKYGRSSRSVAWLVWDLTDHDPIADRYLLVQNREICQESLCVQPDCHGPVLKGMHSSPQSRKKANERSCARWANVSLEKRILKRIIKDDTGCWRWNGQFRRCSRDSKRAIILFRKRTISVRRFLYKRAKGEIPAGHVLCHRTDRVCSHPDECVAPEHTTPMSKEEFGTLVLSVKSPGRRAMKRQRIGRQEWPGTLWELGGDSNCRHCHRSFEHHGAPEWIARKLGFPLNQQYRVCKPTMMTGSLSNYQGEGLTQRQLSQTFPKWSPPSATGRDLPDA